MPVKLSGPMLPPDAGGAQRTLVVLLHGYGADGSDLMALAGHWRQKLPHALFVAPDAPFPCAGGPFGYQWFAHDPAAPHLRLSGARAAHGVLAGFLTGLWAETGLAAADTLLAGFSQGAMMALHTGIALAEAPMGIIAFSGALIPPEGFDEGHLVKPPVCLVHGAADAVVPPAESELAEVTLRARGFRVTRHVSPGAGHTIAPDGLDFATAFIAGLPAAP